MAGLAGAPDLLDRVYPNGALGPNNQQSMVFLVLWLSASILLAIVWAVVGMSIGEREFSDRRSPRRRVAVKRPMEPV